MHLIPTPSCVVTVSTAVVRTLLRVTGWAARTATRPVLGGSVDRQARPSAAAGWTGDNGVGTNPERRFSSAASRSLAGRASVPRGESGA